MPTYSLITPPVAEVFTSAYVRDYLRVDSGIDTDYIDALIVTARQIVESQIWRPLMPQTISMNFDKSELNTLIWNINKAPLIAVTGVTYYDSSNVLQTFAASNYEVDLNGNPARFRLKTVPQCYDRFNALIVTFTCGYANAASVPTPIKQAMLMIIGHLYENRQDVITGTQVNDMPKGSEYLLAPYRNTYIQFPANG